MHAITKEVKDKRESIVISFDEDVIFVVLDNKVFAYEHLF